MPSFQESDKAEHGLARVARDTVDEEQQGASALDYAQPCHGCGRERDGNGKLSYVRGEV